MEKAVEGCNILVDACIGSGKPTSIQYLCDQIPQDNRILYLTYNKLLKLNAKRKAKNKNATVTNYHGFAYGILRRCGVTPGYSDSVQYFIRGHYPVPYYDVMIINEYQDIPRQRYIVQIWNGLAGEDPYLLEQIGKILGISKARVRAIEVKTYHIMHVAARAKNISGEDLLADPETYSICRQNRV